MGRCITSATNDCRMDSAAVAFGSAASKKHRARQMVDCLLIVVERTQFGGGRGKEQECHDSEYARREHASKHVRGSRCSR